MQSSHTDILNTIVARKKQIIAERKLHIDLTLLKEKVNCGQTPALRPFRQALSNSIQKRDIAIIAELKQASPSRGLISQNYDPGRYAAAYQKNHAACLSVLTEEDFFSGHDQHLVIARNHCELPILRKDFIVDEYQVYESRLLGADCILLIAAILEQEFLESYFHLAKSIGLDVLIEVANLEELERVKQFECELIGINNRNLRDFSINRERTVELKQHIHGNQIVVCESGIHTKEDINDMLQHDVHAFLIGEALMKSEDPGEKLAELLA